MEGGHLVMRGAPLLLPQPWQITIEAGEFRPHSGVRLQIGPDAGDATKRTARAVQAAFVELFDLRLPLIPTGNPVRSAAITFVLLGRDDATFGSADFGWESPADRGPQGYTLRIERDGVTIAANDEAGLFYGAQTLIQIARSEGRNWPALTIVDKPAVLTRGYLVDITRGKVHSIETLIELFHQLAHVKANHVQLYTEHAFDFPSEPAIGRGTGALTPDEIVQLDAVCRDLHIELAPNFQSMGHQAHLLGLPEYHHLAETDWRFTFASDNEEVFAFVDRLYGDLLPCFSSRLLNVNADEPWDFGRGVSRALTAELGLRGLFLHHLERLHRLVTKHGRRMAMWADVLKHYPEQIEKLPPDVLLIDWWYEQTDRYASLDALAASGREFWICAATSSWMALYPRMENAVANIRDYVREGVAAGATGVLISDWGDNGHDQPLTNSTYPFLWGAECAWTGARTSRDAFDRAYGLHVLEDRSGALVAALNRLGASTQVEKNWMKTWNSAMALYEEPIAGRVWSVASPEIVAESRAAAAGVQPLLSQVPNTALRHDLSFGTWQMLVACDKVETTRAIRTALSDVAAGGAAPGVFDELIARLHATRSEIAAMTVEFEHRWMARARRSSIQFNLDRYAGLLARFDTAITWLAGEAEKARQGERVDSNLDTYDTAKYAVLHEATFKWVKELEAIIGHDALPEDIKEYLRDVGGQA